MPDTAVARIERRLDSIERLLGTLTARNAEYLSVEEAAEFLKRPVSTIYHLVSRRGIPFRKNGKRLLFSRAELSHWVDSQKVRSEAEVEAEALAIGGRKG